MAKSLNKYQYETSPRKLEPNYSPKKKVAPKKNTAKTNKKTTKKIKKLWQACRSPASLLAL